jgi:hypothetical protein
MSDPSAQILINSITTRVCENLNMSGDVVLDPKKIDGYDDQPDPLQQNFKRKRRKTATDR